MKPTKKPKALWTKCFPKQAKALRPENTRTGGVKSRSQSQAVRDDVYRAINNLYALQFPLCECCGVIQRFLGKEWPVRWRNETHHTKYRDGLLLFDVRYFKSTCAECHQWIHSHVAQAILIGLLAEHGQFNNQEKGVT